MMVKTGGGGTGGSAANQGQGGSTLDNGSKSTRQFFDGEESCYIIDAKLEGNLGRYLNVSTDPLILRGGEPFFNFSCIYFSTS